MSFLKGTAVAAAFALAFAGPVFADKDSDKKKAEKEWKDAEKRQKKDGQAPGQGGMIPAGEMENPLLKILKLMNEVEDRLFDTDTGRFTQEEQRKIVEAMKFEDKTSQALQDLIEQVEKQQQKQAQQGQADRNKRQKQKAKQKRRPNETEKERREREKREQKQKEEERKRKAQDKQNKPQSAKDRERQRREDQQIPPDSVGDLNQPNDASGRWGVLPSKLYQDAENAANHEAPGRWSELIKRYRARLADVD